MSDLRRYKIVSWNVNGIRSVVRKGFLDWLRKERPTVLGLQEVRAELSQVPAELLAHKGYSLDFCHGKKRGYSGVATLSRVQPLSVITSLNATIFDVEARMIVTEYPRFFVYNVYFPKGSGTARDNSRVPYKLEFYRALFAHAERWKRRFKKPLVVMGDFNTAHTDLDLTHPRANKNNSGYLAIEREDLSRHLERGFVDTFRHFHPARVEYSWWSNLPGARARNVGWRIDFVWVSSELLPFVKSAFIRSQVRGSDHAPVGITLAF
jgi:exodeoxyribonuclease-3